MKRRSFIKSIIATVAAIQAPNLSAKSDITKSTTQKTAIISGPLDQAVESTIETNKLFDDLPYDHVYEGEYKYSTSIKMPNIAIVRNDK